MEAQEEEIGGLSDVRTGRKLKDVRTGGSEADRPEPAGLPHHNRRGREEPPCPPPGTTNGWTRTPGVSPRSVKDCRVGKHI